MYLLYIWYVSSCTPQIKMIAKNSRILKLVGGLAEWLKWWSACLESMQPWIAALVPPKRKRKMIHKISGKNIDFFFETGIWTQDFMLAKQVLYCLSHTFSPFCSRFWGMYFENYLPGLVSNPDHLELSVPSI
jgi:hypothetical protein